MQLPHLNPYGRAIKKYMMQIMPDKFNEQVNETIDRAVNGMQTKKDAENFITFLGMIYQSGHDKALQAAQEAMDKNNIKMRIVNKPEKK